MVDFICLETPKYVNDDEILFCYKLKDKLTMKKNRLKQIGVVILAFIGIAKISLGQPIAETAPGTTPGNTGTVKFTYGGNEVTYTTVRAEDGNIWLQQNLGSSKVAGSQNGDVNAEGDLFQWGRWDDGHQTGTALTENTAVNLNPNNPSGLKKTESNPFYYKGTSGNLWWVSGIATDKAEAGNPDDVTATNGCDPCKKIMGGDWRLPTQAEWNTLILAEGISNTSTAFTSNLVIPAIKPRDATTGNRLTNYNTVRYWSGTAGSGGGALVLNLTATVANTTNISRAQGYAVRCINKPVVTPVGFIDFKGKRGSLGVNLEWTVSSEYNNSYYTVKHSVDGIFFKNLSDISGKGNSSIRESYTYVHQNPVLGINYYKLSQTDLDGANRELSTISVTGTALEKEVIIINAADQSVNVLLAGFESKPKKIVISSIIGQQIYEARIDDESKTLPIALKKGGYVARVYFGDKTFKTVKFLK